MTCEKYLLLEFTGYPTTTFHPSDRSVRRLGSGRNNAQPISTTSKADGLHGELGRKCWTLCIFLWGTKRYAGKGGSASGVQLGSGRPCHHSLGRPMPTNDTPCSQRISSSPLSTPLADTSAGFPKMVPSAPPPGSLGGRWTSRNGRGDAWAARRQPRVKADSETRSATGGGSAGTDADAS